jgi:hypothetical protein
MLLMLPIEGVKVALCSNSRVNVIYVLVTVTNVKKIGILLLIDNVNKNVI